MSLVDYRSELSAHYAAVRARLITVARVEEPLALPLCRAKPATSKRVARCVWRKTHEEKPIEFYAPRPMHFRDIMREVVFDHDLPMERVLSGQRAYPLIKARAEMVYRLVVEKQFGFPRVAAILRRDPSTVRNALAVFCEDNNIPIPNGSAIVSRKVEYRRAARLLPAPEQMESRS